MTDSDTIFREVDEDLRREQFQQLWDRWGVYVIAVAVAIVAAVAGYQGWQYWQAQTAAKSGAAFVTAQNLFEDGKKAEAKKSFGQLSVDGPRGYRTLAKFRLAAAKAAEGNVAEAVRDYDLLAKDSGTDEILKGFARIQAALLRVDQAGLDEMKSRLGDLLGAKNSWRHSAREILGLAAYRAGVIGEAEKHYNDILADSSAPASLRQRAQMMLEIVVGADKKTASKATTGQKPENDKKPKTE